VQSLTQRQAWLEISGHPLQRCRMECLKRLLGISSHQAVVVVVWGSASFVILYACSRLLVRRVLVHIV
jgi:hypothetical protein